MNDSGRGLKSPESAYPHDTIECHGGPYDGHVYFISDWEARKASQEHMKALGGGGMIGALDYVVRQGHAYFHGHWKQHLYKPLAVEEEADEAVRAASQRW